MKEYYSEIINKYMPEIEPNLEGQKVLHRFAGLWLGQGARLSGLYVLTDQNILFRGKAKMSAFSSTYSLISSGSKSKNVFMIPLNSIQQVIQKKNTFTIIFGLEWMGGKYAEKHKKDKVAIEMYQGKEGNIKETKEELLQRAGEFMEYIKSSAPKDALFK